MSAPDVRCASPTLRAGRVTWAVRSDDPALVDEVTELYDGCRAPDAATADVSFVIVRNAEAPALVDVYRDAVLVRTRETPALAVAYVVWAMNSEVVANAGSHLLLHAAAGVTEGAALVLSGAEGSGKSTLVAALVRAGLGYVTDEIVAVDPDTGTIHPYAKPIVLEHGSWPLFEDLGPPEPSPNGDRDQWLLAPHRLGRVAIATEPSMPRVLVFPRFEPGAGCDVARVDRAEAVIALCKQSFNFRSRSPGALDVVARLVRGCACYSLRYHDARDAALIARELLGTAAS